MYVITVQFLVQPELAPAFSEAVVEQAKNSLRLERDCRVFDVCVDPDDPASFYLYEKYANEAAFRAHLGSDHFRSFDARVSPWTLEKTIRCWTEVENRQ